MNDKIFCAVLVTGMCWSSISIANASDPWRRFPEISSGSSSISCTKTKDEAIQIAKQNAKDKAPKGYVQVGNWIAGAYEWEGYYSTGDCLSLRGWAYSVFVPEVSAGAIYTFTLEGVFSNPRLQTNDPNAGHELPQAAAWLEAQNEAEAEIKRLCKSVRATRIVSKSIDLFEYSSWYDVFSVRISATCNP